MLTGNPENTGSEAVQAAPAGGGAIFEVGTADFEQRVIAGSMEKPVIAYFTAPWCGPCKQLGPTLDKAVQAAGGEVLMAKINLDENQDLAAALKIQSVPTVFAFFQGRPVDAFQGLVPESQITAFIDKLVQAARGSKPEAIDIPEALKAAAQAVADKDFGTAQAIYHQILQQDEKNAQAYVGLVRVFLAAEALEQAAHMVDNAPEDIASNPAFEEARTALELAQVSPDGSIDELTAKVKAAPKDHQAKIDLAHAQFAAGDKEAAIDTLIESISIDREWNEAAARKALLKFFEALGNADPLTVAGRKKLSSILFS